MRARPFDRTTEAGRAQERHRRAILTAAALAGSRAASVCVTLVSVPLALGYLGPERYGMWMAMASVVAMLGFADLGMGNGLVNEVSRAVGLDDPGLLRRRVATAFLALGAAGAAVLVALALVLDRVDWAVLFNVEDARAAGEAAPAMAVLVGCFALGLPASVVTKVQVGVQAGFVGGTWQGLGAVLSLVALLLVVRLEGGLPYLVLAVAGAPLVVTALNGVVFMVRNPAYRPSLREADRESLRVLVRTGALFVLLQLSGALALASDGFIVARALGSVEVSQYAVPARLFSIAPLVIGFGTGPLWPAYAEALARGDRRWTRETFLRTTRIATLSAAVLSSALLLTAPVLLRAWVGSAIEFDWYLCSGLAAWNVLQVWGQAVATFLNGLGMLRLQIVTGLLFGALCLAARMVAVELIGVPGIPAATIAAFCLVVVVPQWLAVSRALASLS